MLLGKVIVAQLVRKFSAFHTTHRFIAVFTRTRHWALFYAIYASNPHPHTQFL
jgi:predicted ATP-grasp superfamily ATP-dependent carboligase